MLGHPSKPVLLAYAEGLVDGRGIDSATARHVMSCPVCTREVAGIRASIEFAASAKQLDPAEDSISLILVAARNERQATRRVRGRAPVVLFKGIAYAAGVALLSAFMFQAALEEVPAAGSSRAAKSTRQLAAGPSMDEIRRATHDIQTLAAAVGGRTNAPQSFRAVQQAREVLALDAELSAARKALQQNPGSQRASLVMNANLKRQADALKSLYVERSF